MFNFLPYFLLLVMSSLLLILSTLVCAIPILLFAVVRLVLPFAALRKLFASFFIACAEMWITLNKGWMKLTQRTHWDVEGVDQLDKNGWYLITANHQSWVDIFIMQSIFNRKIPFLKFFIKQELIRVPVIGLCWWALDFPFMKRYNKEYLKKYPERRGQDLEATKKSCERFKDMPTSIMNFLEGTRFTKEKHARQKSPFKHLLKPKSGGIAFAMHCMGEQLNQLLNVTIVYPDGTPTFNDFLGGKLKQVIVRVEQIQLPSEFFTSDYTTDQEFRIEFNRWVNDLWTDKDMLIEDLLKKDQA
ncbi:acyltransferase [Microbulbifer sp. OS29]|uniref:Acyltransferase n=1 Tax=Microbulbifer okhotskensis TaxID=2926617 RepID=A0A9X2EL41_9GAMM|nr:acyltransferase [Microbulbifer okhotskensis]MCO1333565.1 acyltransferase [Microbulbifer okhotskensis]